MKKGLLIIALVSLVLVVLPAQGGTEKDGVIEFKIVGNNASTLVTEAAKKMAKEIEEKSNGQLKPILYLEGQLGDNDEDLCTGLSDGNYEMLINPEMLFNWAVPEWMELFNMAFIFDSQDHLQAFWKSDVGAQLAQDLLNKFDVKAYINTIALRGPRYLTANVPVKNVADMAGMKLRTPNNAGVIASWKATGANVTPVAWGELYGALQNGIVSAQENPLANIDQAGMYQVQDYLMQTEHQYTNYFVYMSNGWWSTLNADQQQIIGTAIDNAFTWHNEQVNAEDKKLLAKFIEKGMNFIPKNEIDIQSFKDAIIPVLLEKNKDLYPEGAYEKISQLSK
ncbi:TRAP transporter substrate-binding protein [Oceanispirochaeta crateris]|uniref:TRAP transporter substrate-binding protein n=1 Tax=Oceanispirochaeta crateris TaxID=2518645 RepID=A0A5C1QL08_9SPIO|nr:TRAP transporter substrate-binding protein [Oceanispirochaeta crateris]QEN08157.1 TRAP transporter substrate-binding protein [Oceanispirochaeta crateris]